MTSTDYQVDDDPRQQQISAAGSCSPSYVFVAMLTAMLAAACGTREPAPAATSTLVGDAACDSLELAATGGPSPVDPDLLVVRWLGAANHELSYRGQVVLLDAFYDRIPPARPLGFDAADIVRADAILVGHGHVDHVADAVSVAERTGARVFGGPPTYEYLLAAGLPEEQAVEVAGGESERFDGFEVTAVRAHHSVRRSEAMFAANDAWQELQASLVRERSGVEQERLYALMSRGSEDPRVADEGTIAYHLTFDNGFELVYQDTAGPVTDAQREAMAARQEAEGVDVAILAYGGFFLPEPQIEVTMPLVRLYRPRVFLPTHHDETGGVFPDMATFPLFMQIREELPGTRSLSPLYRTPVCIDTTTGEVAVGP